jgi:hypothetical protein
VRRDLVVTLSPPKANVVDNSGSEVTDIVAYRNTLPSTSYAVMGSAYKQRFDKYNDVFRFINTSGDLAGIMAQSDQLRDPWFSPAGSQRGNVRNVRSLYSKYKLQVTCRTTRYQDSFVPFFTDTFNKS